LGFDYIEFNLESGVSPGSDNDDVVGAMKKAAEAAHKQGLRILAAPSRGYTTDYGTQIAPFRLLLPHTGTSTARQWNTGI
jgi:hypothetical protein